MKRIAYVGLSTPLFYDYANPATRTTNDVSSSPNPILDSAYGLFLLYDEIWFLCESLCPENLRKAPFVKFVDKEMDVPDLFKVKCNIEAAIKENDDEFEVKMNKQREMFQYYNEVVIEKGVKWDARPDNHSHALNICGFNVHGNSMSAENILYDLEILNSIPLENAEFITNKFTESWLKGSSQAYNKLTLAEMLVIDKIPNFLDSRGPYHPCVDLARESNNLKAYRKWVVENSGKIDTNEIKDVKDEVENEISKLQDELFLKYLDPKNCVFSTGKTILGAGVDAISGVPLSTGAGLIGNMLDVYGKKNKRWQAFVIEAKYFK